MTREARTRQCLDYLSLGDAFGELFFYVAPKSIESLCIDRSIPPKLADVTEWGWTDDTVQAMGLLESLSSLGVLDQTDFFRRLVERYQQDPERGYSHSTAKMLGSIDPSSIDESVWKQASQSLFGGSGSHGNGSAMRVPVLGAFFSDEPLAIIAEYAAMSADVTHSHLEAHAGAISVALACALCCRSEEVDIIGEILPHVPSESEVYKRLKDAAAIPFDGHESVIHAANLLGNGSQGSCFDTVPFVVWIISAYRSIENGVFEAIWEAASVGGDMDTICAMVAGCLGMSERQSIPDDYWSHRERLYVDEILPCPYREEDLKWMAKHGNALS